MAGGESCGQRPSRICMRFWGRPTAGLGASRPIKRRHGLVQVESRYLLCVLLCTI